MLSVKTIISFNKTSLDKNIFLPSRSSEGSLRSSLCILAVSFYPNMMFVCFRFKFDNLSILELVYVCLRVSP